MKDKHIGVQWTNKPFETLGTWFSSNPEETAHLNTTSKLNHINVILLAIETAFSEGRNYSH